MLCSEAVLRIQRKLGYRSDKADEILDELRDVQQTFEMGVPAPGGHGTFMPWFLTSEVASALTTIGDERMQLPTDFAGDLQDSQLFYFNPDADELEDEWVPLQKGEESFIRGKFVETGAPGGFFYSGSYWRVLPVSPDTQYTLKIVYANKDTPLTLTPDITNKWLTNAPWLLISAAGIAMAQSLRDPNALTYFQQRFAVEQTTLFTATEARSDVNDRPVMGGYN